MSAPDFAEAFAEELTVTFEALAAHESIREDWLKRRKDKLARMAHEWAAASFGDGRRREIEIRETSSQ